MTTFKPDAQASKTPLSYDSEELIGSSNQFYPHLNQPYPKGHTPESPKRHTPHVGHFKRNTTLHRFTSWDDLDEYVTQFLIASTGIEPFDFLRWRFEDSDFWHDELYPIPVGAWIITEWTVLQ